MMRRPEDSLGGGPLPMNQYSASQIGRMAALLAAVWCGLKFSSFADQSRVGTRVAAKSPAPIQGPIRSVDPQAATSLAEQAGQGIFPQDVVGRLYPDGAFVEGVVWGSLGGGPTVFKPKNSTYREVPGAEMPPFRV